MKDKNHLQILASKEQVLEHRMDRVVPLPGFNMDAFPFVFVNDRDIMDVRAGDLVDACVQLIG